LFLKKTEGTESINKLQVMWYQVHDAESHLFISAYGPSIKQYQNIFNHFDTFWKNQTDFHRYAYRKCAIYAYINMLKWNDTLRNHPFFMRAAKNAINIWFKIYELQNTQNFKELEVGSSPQNAIDKKKHRQNDPRGWKLIHNKQPLNKAKEWLDALLPLIDCIKQNNANDETILFILIANLKYLFYTKQYQQLVQNVDVFKETYSQFVDNPYYVYNIFIIVNKLENNEECKELIKEYNTDFLKSYFEQNTNDFKRMRYVLKCCLEIHGLCEKIGYSIKDILENIMKTKCSPLQCVDIRNDLISSENNKELQIFEIYVSKRYPLQLKTDEKDL